MFYFIYLNIAYCSGLTCVQICALSDAFVRAGRPNPDEQICKTGDLVTACFLGGARALQRSTSAKMTYAIDVNNTKNVTALCLETVLYSF